MIAKMAPPRSSGRGSFIDLRDYLEREGENQREDLVASWSGNVASHATADIEMARVGNLGKANDPVVHIVLSWRPGEVVDEKTAFAAVDATLRSMDATDRQWYAAMHDDGERVHVHVGVNRVHPQTRTLLPTWMSHMRLARAAEWIEREFGCLHDNRPDWRSISNLGELDLSYEYTPEQQERVQMARMGAVAPEGASTAEADEVRRAGYSWAQLIRTEAVPAALARIQEANATWEALHGALESYGLRLVPTAKGHRVEGAEPGQHLGAGRVGLDIKDLEKQLGPFRQPDRTPTPFEERVKAAREAVEGAQTWSEAHSATETLGLALQGGKMAGRVVDLAENGRKVAMGTALGESLRDLEKRFGPYEASPALEAQRERERERRAFQVRERTEILAEQPELIVARISETRSTWDSEDANREIRGILDVPPDAREWDESIKRLVDASLNPEHVVSLGFVADLRPGAEPGAKREIFSHADIVEYERALHAAADAVAARTGPQNIREMSEALMAESNDDLRAQMLGAYQQMTGPAGLAIVQGIAGAGKSRLLRDVAEAYTQAGYRVLGTAVSGDAARVLGDEANIKTQTVARLRVNLEAGRETLDKRTVLIVDEASMLGTKDARLLLEAAQKGGAVVRLLGDERQHGSVSRGAVLEDLTARHGSFDMQHSRRAQQPWLREVASDLRTGHTPHALDVLRKHGAIGEYRSAGEAKAALVAAWAADVRADRAVLLIGARRSDVADLNERAREALSDRLGEARAYSTAYGERQIAVGELLVARVADRGTQTVNGDALRVLGHREDGRLDLQRVRDGAPVTWDVQERSQIDYGYATTSYRSQGSTVDGVYIYASQADDQRGIYVDVTRARETVRIAYGRDEIPNFGALLNVAARERVSSSVAAAEAAVAAYAAASTAEEMRVEAEQTPTRADVRPPQWEQPRADPPTQAERPKPPSTTTEQPTQGAEPAPQPAARMEPHVEPQPAQARSAEPPPKPESRVSREPERPSPAPEPPRPQQAEPPRAEKPQPQREPEPQIALKSIAVGDLSAEIAEHMKQLAAQERAAKSLIESIGDYDPKRPVTSEDIAAYRIAQSQRTVEAAEAEALRQRRETNDSWIGFSRSDAQKYRDEQSVRELDASRAKHAENMKRFADERVLSEMDETIRNGVAARAEIERTEIARREFTRTMRDLRTAGVQHVNVPERGEDSFAERIRTLHEVAKQSVPPEQNLDALREQRARERTQAERDRAAEKIDQEREQGRSRARR